MPGPTEIVHIAKKQQGLYATTADLIRERTADAEKRLAATMRKRTALACAQRVPMYSDLETALIARAKVDRISDAIPGITVLTDAQKDLCADSMIPLFLRSLKPDGVGIGLLEPMPSSADMVNCGFPAGPDQEKNFMAYFTQFFVPYVAVELLPNLNAVTLSEKERRDINSVLGEEGLGASHLPQTIDELKNILLVEWQGLVAQEKLEELDSNTITLGVAGMDVIPPAAPGSRREAIEKVIGTEGKFKGCLSDERLQERLDYMNMLNNKDMGYGNVPLTSILNKVNAIPVYDTTIGTTAAGQNLAIGGTSTGVSGYALDGDGDPATNTAALVKLSELRNPDASDPQRESKIALAEAIDEVSTRPAAIADEVAKLALEETALRAEIWAHRQKEVADLLDLLPSDEYQAFLVHQNPAFVLAGPSDLEKVIQFLGFVAAQYGPPAVTAPTQKQKDTLEVITKLGDLAQAIHAENTALATAFVGVDFTAQAPTEVQANAPAVLAARNQRKAAEQGLEKLGINQNVKIAEQEWRYGQIQAKTQGDKISLEEAEWENKRIEHHGQLIAAATAPILVGVPADRVPIEPSLHPLNLPHTAAQLLAADPGPSTAWIYNGSEYNRKKQTFDRMKQENAAEQARYDNLVTQKNAILSQNIKNAKARADNQLKTAAYTNLRDPLSGAIPVKGDGSREDKDKPFVSVRVRNKEKGKNETDILLSKNFRIGKEGKALDAAETRLKVMDLLIYDQANHGYHVAAGKQASTVSTAPGAAERAALGGDLGDGRLSSVLNAINDTNFRAIEKDLATPDVQTKWVCEMKEGGSFNVYRADVNNKTGQVTKSTKTLTEYEKTMVKTEMNKLLLEGLKPSSKVAYEGEAAVAVTFPKDAAVITRVLDPKPEAQLKINAGNLKPKPEAKKPDNTRLLWGDYSKAQTQKSAKPTVKPSALRQVREFFSLKKNK